MNMSEFLTLDLDWFTLVKLQLTYCQKEYNFSQLRFEQLMSFTSTGKKRF